MTKISEKTEYYKILLFIHDDRPVSRTNSSRFQCQLHTIKYFFFIYKLLKINPNDKDYYQWYNKNHINYYYKETRIKCYKYN